jgi:hypothetical protein
MVMTCNGLSEAFRLEGRGFPDGRLPKADLYVYGMVESFTGSGVNYVSDLLSLTNFFDANMQWVLIDFSIIS